MSFQKLILLLAFGLFAQGQVGETAPGFSLQDIDGKTHSLSDYGGKAILLFMLGFS